ncbi:MAG: HD-GYP domain-containing protein [Rhizobium sp.]|nr:HD-GYP domain-containing protein [Rhizobium sp.]
MISRAAPDASERAPGCIAQIETQHAMASALEDFRRVFGSSQPAADSFRKPSDRTIGLLAQKAKKAPGACAKMNELLEKDQPTCLHSVSVSTLMMSVGQRMNMTEELVIDLGFSGLLHDIGKIEIPDTLLNKALPLNSTDRRLLQRHPDAGFKLLSLDSGVSQMTLDICRYHHELLDGSGYPAGLKGTEISLAVRITTVCDVFDALTTRRPYKRSWSAGEALRWLYQRPNHYDSDIVRQLDASLAPNSLD